MSLPVVYLEITRGRAICKGIKGTAISPNCSLGMPVSTSFKDITLSVAEKPIYKLT